MSAEAPDLKNIDSTSNVSKNNASAGRSKSNGPKKGKGDKLHKATSSVLKKYFVQLMDIDEILPHIKPKQLLDLDTTGGCVQPVINL